MSQTYNLGKVAVTPRGAYSSTAQYTPLDIFSYNGSSYLVLQNCMGVTPPNSTYYQVLAQKGTNGQNGSAANIAAGTVTMLPVGSQATVTNSGTSGNAIFNFGIPYSSISDNSVSTAKIVDSAVTTNKIADEAVTTDELQDRAVTTDKLQDRAVTTDKIADGSVSTPKIANGSVTEEKLGADVVDTLNNKANIDGSYSDMTVGLAEQLQSNVGIEDKVPYNFRTSGGSIDIGDRERVDGIIGGTVCWNQLAYGLDSDHWQTDGSATVSYADGVASILASARYGGIESKYDYRPPNAVTGEKVLAVGDFKISGSGNVGALTLNTVSKGIQGYSDWQTFGMIVDWDSSNNNRFRIRDQRTSDWNTFYVKNVIVVNLTRAFGAIIADYVYSLEQTTSGAGVTWFRKLFPEAQNAAYSSPSLLSVKTSSHKMTGFNQWDEEWELGTLNWSTGANATSTTRIRSKNYIPCVGDTVYYVRIPTSAVYLFYYDADKNFISYLSSSKANTTFTTPSNARYIRFFTASNEYGTTYNHDICINIHWDGERDGEYEAYQEWNYPLDSDLELRGIPKLDANNKLYYDGDIYAPDGTVTRRYGVVDLGTLTWSKSTATDYMNFYSTGISSLVEHPADIASGTSYIICSKYANNGARNYGDGYIYITTAGQIRIKDTANASLTAEEFKSLLSGVYAVYKLATPTTEQADPYQQTQNVSDWGTEEYVDNRSIPVPVGNNVFYQSNLKAKLEMMPDSPDGAGDYIMRSDGSQQTWVALTEVKELPDFPATDGNYRLRCTVADGEVTLSWVSE